VVWTRTLTLGHGESTTFTYSVNIDDVMSGTIIENSDYSIKYLIDKVAIGEPHTVTVIAPILLLSKETWPLTLGSNRVMTYTILVLNNGLNKGSVATTLVIT
jgi:hypothetical protein